MEPSNSGDFNHHWRTDDEDEDALTSPPPTRHGSPGSSMTANSDHSLGSNADNARAAPLPTFGHDLSSCPSSRATSPGPGNDDAGHGGDDDGGVLTSAATSRQYSRLEARFPDGRVRVRSLDRYAKWLLAPDPTLRHNAARPLRWLEPADLTTAKSEPLDIDAVLDRLPASFTPAQRDRVSDALAQLHREYTQLGQRVARSFEQRTRRGELDERAQKLARADGAAAADALAEAGQSSMRLQSAAEKRQSGTAKMSKGGASKKSAKGGKK